MAQEQPAGQIQPRALGLGPGAPVPLPITPAPVLSLFPLDARIGPQEPSTTLSLECEVELGPGRPVQLPALTCLGLGPGGLKSPLPDPPQQD